MKSSKVSQAIASILVLALAVGVIPTSAMASEEVQEFVDQVEEATLPTADPMLGVQSGVEDIPSEVPAQPRSREELLSLDSVVLSEDGEPVAILGSKDNITFEEMKILFSPTANYTLRSESDPNQDLREQFGLTDADIEQGSSLHGSRLAYTSELSSLVIKSDSMNISETQMMELAGLISSGYSCYHAMRALVAKELLGFTMDELKAARQQEIQAEEQEINQEAEPTEREEDLDKTYPPAIVGLPTTLVERALEATGAEVQSIERDITAAMRQIYSAQTSNEESGLMTVAVSGGITYAPEEVLGQPYRYVQQGNFNVNLNTGSYSYSETDLSIPGKNGLDLVLTRQYHSDRANTIENASVICADQNVIHRDMFKVHYRWYEVDIYGEFQELVDQNNYHADNSYTEARVSVEEIFAFDDYESAVQQKATMAAGGISSAKVFDKNGREHIIKLIPAIDIIDELTFEEYVYGVGRDDSFYVDEFGLGHGWMLGLSHLRWIRYGGGELDTSTDRRIQLNLSDGTQYMVDEYLSGNGIENYDGEDIKFRSCAQNEYQNAQYALCHKDGKIEYFNGNGQNIAIRDRFGNAITIAYTTEGSPAKVKKIQITDTVGNKVVYKEIPLDDTQWYTVKTPGGSKHYNRKWTLSLNEAVVRTYYSYAQDRSVSSGITHPVTLLAVENEAGECTSYGNMCTPVFYNCFLRPIERESLNTDRKLHVTDGYDLQVAMYKVYYPNGGIESISYNQKPMRSFNGNGYRHYIRCDKVDSMSSASNSNPAYTQYTYGDFDQFEPWHYGDESYVTTAKSWNQYVSYEQPNVAMPWVNNELTYTFNTSAQNTKVEKRSYSAMPLRQDGVPEADKLIFKNQSSWISQIVDYEYANTWSLWPTEISTTHKDANSGEGIAAEEKYTYDEGNKGNILSYQKPNGQTENYTYDETYSIPLTITRKQNENTTLITTNTLSADKKSILQTETKSNGVTVSKSAYRYDGDGQLIARDDYRDAENFVTTTYSYGNGALPAQVSVSGVKTAGGTFAAATPGFAVGTVVRKQTYNDRGWITSETDANGNTISYSYDAVGRLTGVTFPDGSGLSYSYTVASTSTVIYTDQAENQWKCAYGKSGKLLSVKDLTNNKFLEERTYDRHDNLVKQVIYGESTPDQTTYYRYDTDGRLIELEQVGTFLGETVLYRETYEYRDGEGKVTKTIAGDDGYAPSVVTTSYQDKMGNVVKTGIFRNGVEELSTFAYDYLGNQTQSKTAYSASQSCAYTTNSTYDHAGRVLTITDAKGNTTSHTYDWLGNQLTMTAPKDQNPDPNKTKYPTVYSYDALNRLVRVVTPLAAGHNGRTDYTYDANGNVTQEYVWTGGKDSLGARNIYYTYDSLNRVTQVKGNARQDFQSGANQYQYTNYTYDARGNIATMSVGDGTSWHTAQYTYDRYSRLLTQKDPLGQTESYIYDLNGNLTSKTDRRGVTTTNTYDAMGRLTGSTASSDRLSYTYTMTGQRRTAVYNNQTTTYTYNSAGDLIEEDTPVAQKTMTYGVGGLRTSFTVTANNKTYLDNQYSYNKLGQLVKVNSGNIEAHYSYDSNGNVTNVTNGNGTTASYTYNKADLVTEIKNKTRAGADLSNFKYTYSADGNQLTETDSRGATTSYTYDGLNRLVQESQTGTLGAFTNTYTYDDYSNRSQAALAGATTNYTYDANNRLLSTTGGEIASYAYDANGNMTQAVFGTGAGARTVSCVYDGFGRLEKVSDNGKETVYTYDADGLRISKRVYADREYYVYDNGQLVAMIMGTPNLLLSKTLTTTPLSWTQGTNPLEAHKYYYVQVNGENYVCYAAQEVQRYAARVTMSGEEVPEVPPGSETWPTVLHAGEVNIRITPSANFSNYTFEITGPVGTQVNVYDSNPVPNSAVYIRGVGLIASRTETEGLVYYHYDAHGNVVQRTSGGNTLAKDYYYDAFGVEQNADPADTNPFRYCGEQYDTETGNYYLRARYYAPGVGRFTQEDPIRDGLNWYAYCGGNPIAYYDPSGLSEVLLSDIVKQYGGTWGRADQVGIYVDFGSQGRKEFDWRLGSFLHVMKNGLIFVNDKEFIDTFGIVDSRNAVRYSFSKNSKEFEEYLNVAVTTFRRGDGRYSGRITVNGQEAYFGSYSSGKLSSRISIHEGARREWSYKSGDIAYDIGFGLGHVLSGWGSVVNNAAGLLDWSRETSICPSDIVIEAGMPDGFMQYIYINSDPGRTVEIHDVLGAVEHDFIHAVLWFYDFD